MLRLPNGWETHRLGDVAKVQTGLAKGKKTNGGSVRLPYLRVANVQDGYVDLTELKTIDVSKSEVERYSLRAGDVLFTEGGDYDKLGRGCVWTGQVTPCLHQNHVFAVRPNADVVISDYLSAVSSGSYGKKYFLWCAKQTTNLASVNSTQLKEFPIPVPPLTEQLAITAVLSTWDRAIEHALRLIEAKKKLKQGLMQQLLTGKRRFADYDGDWPRSHIGDLLKEEDRLVEWDDTSLYRLASVRRWNGGMFSREHLYGKQIKVKKLKAIRAGDFVISHIQGAYGAMALVSPDFDGAKVSDLYSVLVPRDEGSFDIRFFNYLSQTPRMRSKIYAACNGFFAERLRLNFSPRDFLRQTVRVPADLEEQHRIADVLDAITSEISLLQRRLEAVRRQKKGLMQKLLTGQVRVNA